jgi:hypothetical protein
MTQQKRRKRIIFDVTLDEHTEIKTRAARRNMTIGLYIKRALNKCIMEERKYEEEHDTTDTER